MKKPLTDEDLLTRASVDGRVLFAMAAFTLAVGLVALLDRVGVPQSVVGLLSPILAMAGLSLIGLLLHAVRVSRFYAAGRIVPPPYAGLATVALMTAMALPFMPPLPRTLPLTSVLLGFALGLAATAILTGPLLRKTGAFSLPDLIASRFPHAGVRLTAIAAVGAAALLVAIAGLQGSIHSLSLILGAEQQYAALLATIVLAMIIVPGGMLGLVWSASGAAGIFIAALCLPLAAILLGGQQLPMPLIGDPEIWNKAMVRLGQWHGGNGWSSGSFSVSAVGAIGVACLAPLLSPALTTNDTYYARRAGLSAMAWSCVIFAIVLVTVAASALLVGDYLIGVRPDRMPPFAYAASGGGLLKICGASVVNPEQALEACRASTGFGGLVLRPQDVSPKGLWLLHSLPELHQFSVAFSGLVGAAFVSISLVFAAAGFQAFGTAIGHDGLYRARSTSALTSRRLAMTRIVMLVAIAGAGLYLSQFGIDARQAIGLAILISTAAIAPLLALSLWPRATGADAAIALLFALGAAAAVFALRGASLDIVSLSIAALAAAVAGLAAGIAVSFLHSGGLATEGSAFVHGLLHGETDVLNRDKGA